MHKAPLQGTNEIVINTDAATVFAVLEDGALLPRWMTPVKSTTAGKETVGCVRECQVEMDGRKGVVREKCIESIPPERISWALEQDTLGFNKMLRDFSFSFVLKSHGTNKTLVVNKTYYLPRGWFASLMNILMLRSKFAKVRTEALKGIKRIVEDSDRQAISS